VNSRYEDKFKAGAQQYLDAGEQVITAFIAQPRGSGQAMSGNLIAGEIGGRQARKARASGEATGLIVSRPMALAVTPRHVLTLKISSPFLGRGGEVKELLSKVPIEDVDGVRVRRFGLAKRITVTVGGQNVELEGNVGATEFADAFERAKAAAPQAA